MNYLPRWERVNVIRCEGDGSNVCVWLIYWMWYIEERQRRVWEMMNGNFKHLRWMYRKKLVIQKLKESPLFRSVGSCMRTCCAALSTKRIKRHLIITWINKNSLKFLLFIIYYYIDGKKLFFFVPSFFVVVVVFTSKHSFWTV